MAREQKGYSKQGWLPTRHGWHVLSTLPCQPGTGNQFLGSTLLPYQCAPSVSLPRGQATPQAMAQHGARAVGRCYWDHPLALQAGTYPSKASPIPQQPPVSHPLPGSEQPPCQPGQRDTQESLGHWTSKSSTRLQCGQFRGWQSQTLLPCGLMLPNQLCKSGQCLCKLYLPKTQALQKIKIPLKAWEHSYLSEEVSCFLLLHVVRKGILYPSSFMFFFSFILIP